ncbi:hypothetical protein IV203_013129 [Nitzschia inconspicua]|uniref:Uncharacterized protein n=1 Tax=Nitzschia inconspicua TaxID=303405 RepID=A0A9K3M562_9STRA|nr:hypothetical protein IV203_013129 [Nitzschia inconspicua]
MGELTGELAEGYKRLMAKKKKVEAGGGEVVIDASKTDGATKTETSQNAKNEGIQKSKYGLSSSVKSTEVQQQTPSSTSGTRNGIQPAPSIIPRRPSQQRPFSQESRFFKLQKQRYTHKQSQEKENGNNVNEKNEQMDEQQLIHVSSGVSGLYARTASSISVETRRAGNTSKVSDHTLPVKLEIKTRSVSLSSKQPPREKAVIDPTSVEAVQSSRTHAVSDKDSVDSFPPLDWQKIEHEARSFNDYNEETDLAPVAMGDNLVAEPFNPQKDGISVSHTRSQRSEKQLNDILEEQAESLFSELPQSEQGTSCLHKDPQSANGQCAQNEIRAPRDALQSNVDDTAVEVSTQSVSTLSLEQSPKSSPPRTARAYHRPHSGEMVVIDEKGEEKREGHLESSGMTVSTDTKLDTENKDDGDSKSDASGLPSWTSIHSEKKKRAWNHRPKRRPRRTPPSRVQRKDGDPLGRAVSMAFDQIAGYAGFQEDTQSLTANEAHDDYAYDEEYLSDESESIMADIHDALFSTFGCTVPRTRLRQLNDDDTLETDGGSKVSANKYIRHARSGSDSVYSEPSMTIPSVASCDKTDEGTHDDDATDEMTETTKKSFQSKEPPKRQASAPKYKVPDKFAEEPPEIPNALSASDKLPLKNTASSVYSDNTDMYRAFVEKDHEAVNLLEEADNFLFKEAAGKNFLKVANENVDKWVTSIQGFLLSSSGAKRENKVAHREVPKSVSPSDSAKEIENPPNMQLGEEIDSNKEVTAFDFAGAVEDNNPIDAVLQNEAVKPIQEHLPSEELVERQESLFAASPKDSRQLERNSDSGSDQTLEELKLMLIEEAGAMPPIATNSKSVISSGPGEEKKEEESTNVKTNTTEGFEFEETFFSTANNVFSEALEKEEENFVNGPKVSVIEPLSFSHGVEPKFTVTEFGAEFGDVLDDTLSPTELESQSGVIDGDGFPDFPAILSAPLSQEMTSVAIATDELEVTKNHCILVFLEECGAIESAVAPACITKLEYEESKSTKVPETHSLTSEEVESENSKVLSQKFPAFDDGVKSADPPASVASESLVAQNHTETDFINSSKKLVLSKATTPGSMKNKGGVMKGLFRSFKKKGPKSSPVASTARSQTNHLPRKTKQPEYWDKIQSSVADKRIANQHVQASRQTPMKAATSMTARQINSDVNYVMEDYLSKKFEKVAGQLGSSNSSERLEAKSASAVPKQQNDSISTIFGDPSTIDMAFPTPKQASAQDKNSPFTFDISPIRETDVSIDFSQGWEKPHVDKNSQMSSVFRRETNSNSLNSPTTNGTSAVETPERKNGETRIPNTPVKWRHVQDHSNEGC